MALVVRLLVVAALLANPERAASGTDANQFLILGENLARHGVFSQSVAPPYLPDPIRTPGYPALIALLVWLFGPRPLVPLLLVQAVIGAATAAGAAHLARALFDGRGGWAAGLLAALAPASAVLGGFASSETVFAAVLVGGSLLVVRGLERDRRPLSVLGGVAFGVAALTRPIALMLLPVLVLAPLVRLPLRRAWRHALPAAAAFLLLAGAWMARNAAMFGHASLSSISDVNLFYYNAAGMEARRLGISLDDARRDLEARLGERPADETAWGAAAMGDLARATILAHPVTFAWANALDALNGLRPGFSYMLLLFGDPDTIDDPIQTFRSGGVGDALRALPRESIPLLALEGYLVLFTVVLVGLALAGVVVLIARLGWMTARARWLALVIAALTPLILLYLPGVASNARFRAPTEPFLAVLAAAAWIALRGVLRRSRPETG